jgi:hypothetical protein
VTVAVRTARRSAAAASAVFAVLLVVFGSRYLRQHGGWDVATGSNDLIAVLLLVLGLTLALSFALLRSERNGDGARLISIVWSLALLAALLFTWHVIVVADRWTEQVGVPITNPDELDAFMAAHPESFVAAYRVPTGVFLQSFEFLNASNVEMTGYVWQTYGSDIPDHVARGVVLPEALEDAYEASEAWRVETEEGVQIGWYFSGTFRQNFDYRLYPFDRQDIWLRIWSPEVVEGVLLVPDFTAYRDLSPETLPGVDTQFVYGGWDPVASGFSFGLLDDNVDFGLAKGFTRAPEPELYFNFAVERDFLGPLLEHLVLEIVIAIILFLLLVLMAHGSEQQERVGLTIFDLIVAAGGLLFVVILDHNAIRGVVASQGLVYLEWFPLILDVFVVLVVLSAVLRVKQWRLPVLGYRGDLVPVLAYWPALLSTLLTVTLLIFFV